MNRTQAPTRERSDFIDALQKGLLLGAAVLLVVLPPKLIPFTSFAPKYPAARSVQVQPAQVRLASFGAEEASADARHVANWALASGDTQNKAFVIVDKKAAKVFVFAPDGTLKAATAALMGSAHGDHTVPGIGDKPIAEVLPEERTTPAGRFVAEPGMNTKGEDIIWVDYNAAVSMHRVRPNVAAERRLERLASPEIDDNRISYGCINLPVAFYEGVLSPTVKAAGAIIYVLPETTTPQLVFNSYDVGNSAVLAQLQKTP
jgi:hypothetical protein